MALRIVVTGAKGFVGSVFALRAVERGHQVLALDDESRGLNPIASEIGDSYQVFDCRKGVREAVKAAGWDSIDAVAHFAAATGSLDRPLDELRELNVDMTQHVYADALDLDAKTFLWPTTSLAIEVPDSPYVISKEEALAKLREVDKQARISVPLRFFNVLGAYKGLSELRKNEVHILPMMMKSVFAGEPFVVNGDDYENTIDGTPSRDFIHVLDVAEYLLHITEGRAGLMKGPALPGLEPFDSYLAPKPDRSDGAVWLCRGMPTTVGQLIALFEQFTGVQLPHRIGPRRAFDCGRLDGDAAQIGQFRHLRDGGAPAWVAVRDEVKVLREHAHELWTFAPAASVDEAVRQYTSR